MISRIYRTLSGSVSLSVAVGLVMASTTSAAEQLTATQILEKAEEAMAPPIQYTMTVNGRSMLITEALRPNGEHAVRMESKSPIHEITLQVGDESYEIYPDYGVLVETAMINDDPSLKDLATRVDQAGAPEGGLPDKRSSIRKTVMRNGKECFEIESVMSSQTLEWLSRMVPDGEPELMPGSTVYVIDKQTFDYVEVEELSMTGATLSKSEYTNVTHDVEISDELFLPPDGLDVKKPASVAEYMELLEAFATQPVMEDFERQARENRQLYADDSQAHTEAVRREAESMTQAALDRADEIVKEAREESSVDAFGDTGSTLRLGAASSSPRRMLLIVNLLVIACGLAYAAFVRRRRAAAK